MAFGLVFAQQVQSRIVRDKRIGDDKGEKALEIRPVYAEGVSRQLVQADYEVAQGIGARDPKGHRAEEEHDGEPNQVPRDDERDYQQNLYPNQAFMQQRRRERVVH